MRIAKARMKEDQQFAAKQRMQQDNIKFHGNVTRLLIAATIITPIAATIAVLA